MNQANEPESKRLINRTQIARAVFSAAESMGWITGCQQRINRMPKQFVVTGKPIGVGRAERLRRGCDASRPVEGVAQ